MRPIITAGLDRPGFSCDLSTWNLEIIPDGMLTQWIHELDYSQGHKEQLSVRSRHISESEISRIYEVAQKVDFGGLPDRLKASVTDQPMFHISIIIDNQPKRTQVYGPLFLARDWDDGPDRRVWRFVELWEELIQHVDFPPTNYLTLAALDEASRWE